jgi:glutamyl-tRNA reductase
LTLLALGLNHGSASVDTRGRFAIAAEALPQSVHGLREHLGAASAEAAILSTCNRTELDIAANDERSLKAPALDWLAARAGWHAADLDGHAYALEGSDAARHAFRVAAGLDSQVLGEPMILGQLKQAVRAAETVGGLGRTLHQLFQRSFSVAKEVRTTTEIGTHSVSLAATAVQVALRLFGDLSTLQVLCVGAGDMIERVATHFKGRHPKSMTIANRSADRGEALAARLGVATMPLADLPRRLEEFDVVISCTASTLPLIGLGAVERALKARRRRPMLLFDLAVPRDIEPEVARLPDAYLHTIDDLAQSVGQSGAHRLAAVHHAEALIADGVRSFGQWLAQRDRVPLICSLQQRAASWRAEELARAHRRIARGEPMAEVLESLARGLTGKMLHGPLAALHATDQEPALADTVTQLFLRPHPRCGLDR